MIFASQIHAWKKALPDGMASRFYPRQTSREGWGGGRGATGGTA